MGSRRTPCDGIAGSTASGETVRSVCLPSALPPILEPPLPARMEKSSHPCSGGPGYSLPGRAQRAGSDASGETVRFRVPPRHSAPLPRSAPSGHDGKIIAPLFWWSGLLVARTRAARRKRRIRKESSLPAALLRSTVARNAHVRATGSLLLEPATKTRSSTRPAHGVRGLPNASRRLVIALAGGRGPLRADTTG
jgi:hypothetical protein